MARLKQLFPVMVIALLMLTAAPAVFSQTGGQAEEVIMRDSAFEPAELTIAPGTTVTWTNEDGFPHTVTSGTREAPSDLFDSGNIEAGGTYSYTFDEVGTFEYYCELHPGMAGTIIVQEGADMGTPGDDETLPITVEDQELTDSTVTVASVSSEGPGWMVIHADADGAPGAVLGYAAVLAGDNTDVVVEIDATQATETLYAMLHIDAGEEGTYEFPGPDAPAQSEGEVIVVPFTVSGLDTGEAQQAQATGTPTVAATPTAAVTPTAAITATATVTATGTTQPGTLPTTGAGSTPWLPVALLAGGALILAAGTYVWRRQRTADVHVDK